MEENKDLKMLQKQSDCKICFIYKNKCHPVSQTYADAIEANSYKIKGPIDGIWNGLVLPTYRWYFIESVMSMVVPVTKRMLGKKVKIIFRGNDGLFGERTGAYLDAKNPIKKAVLLFLIRQMDGIIVESEMTKKDAQQWIKAEVPIEVCESYIENKEALEKIKPKLETNNFLFMGEYRPPYDHKNIEGLLEIFAFLPEWTLFIIGKNTKHLKKKAPKNVEILDFVENKEEWYGKTSYYIHLPKYEAGPITLLEAMTAGLIPITNKNAGHHPLVEQGEKQLIIDTKKIPSEIAKKIEKIVQMPQKEKQKISETFKNQMKYRYNEKEMIEKFQHIWNKIIKAVIEK